MNRFPSRERPFALGRWSVDPARGVLVRDGRETRIEPQLVELLLLFAGSGGRVLSKDEIIAAVWQGRAIGDDTLAAAISRLRAALGESKSDRYIETIPKRGYRLLAAQEDLAKEAPPQEGGDTAALIAKGHAALRSRLAPGLAQARLYFERALATEPGSAAAQAGLAETFLQQHIAGQSGALLAAARASAQAAIARDPEIAPAHVILGMVALLSARDFATADRMLQRAVALDPRAAPARRARAFALAAVGRFSEAEREARRSIECEPVSLSARGDLAQILLMARRYPQVLAETARTLSLDSHAGEAWSARGWALALTGQDTEARDAFLESLKAWGVTEAALKSLGAAYDTGGLARLCSRAADLFETQTVLFVPRPTDLAMLRAFAGEADGAIAALEKAAAREDPFLLWVVHMPQIDRLRNDPRFAALLARIRPLA